MPSAWQRRPGPEQRSVSARDAAPLAHQFDPGHRLEGADETAPVSPGGLATTLSIGVDAVRAIDIGDARLAPHHRHSRGSVHRRVRGGIVRAAIRFGFDDPAGGKTLGRSRDDDAAEQRPRDRSCRDRRRRGGDEPRHPTELGMPLASSLVLDLADGGDTGSGMEFGQAALQQRDLLLRGRQALALDLDHGGGALLTKPRWRVAPPPGRARRRRRRFRAAAARAPASRSTMPASGSYRDDIAGDDRHARLRRRPVRRRNRNFASSIRASSPNSRRASFERRRRPPA